MDNLISIESRVKNILEQHTEARNNDMELYRLICDESLCMLPNYPNIPFDYVLRNYEKLGCPRFESVRRTRQMVQKKHPELGCSPVVRRLRERGEADFKHYSKMQKEVS